MAVVLKVVAGPREGLEFRSVDRSAITIGRSKANDFHVLDTTMSRVHAVVACDDDGWYVEDQKSRNGIYVNGARVDRHALSSGEVFRLGTLTEICFEDSDEIRSMVTGEVEIVPRCAGCGAIVTIADMVRGADRRPYHFTCRNLDHLIGQQLGEFLVVDKLPPRGQGFLFRAHHDALSRSVMLSVFDSPLIARPGFRDALLREVRRASQFLHPNVLQILDFGEERGMCYVVMEYFEGEPLSRVLQERRFVRIRGAVTVAIRALEALNYAREQGDLMTSVSPERVLVSARHDVKLNLFVEPPPEDADGIPLNEAPYLPPEVMSGDSTANDPTSLVYSVAAVLYHMLAGIPPFEGDDLQEIARRARVEKPPALRRINLKVSPALEKAVQDGMHRRPESRPQMIDEFIRALKRASGVSR